MLPVTQPIAFALTIDKASNDLSLPSVSPFYDQLIIESTFDTNFEVKTIGKKRKAEPIKEVSTRAKKR